MIYQCGCRKIKTGPPWRSSATKPFLCDDCARTKVVDKVHVKSDVEEKKRLISAVVARARVVKR